MNKNELVGGLDEVGWGSPAGPLISVVVVTRPTDLVFLPKGVTDSKKLSAAKREALFRQILAAVQDVGLGSCEPREIDAMSPRWALQESYTRALAELRYKPDLLIVDGTEFTNKVKSWNGKQLVVPKADLHYVQVSAASIVAKVIRDQVMVERARLLRKNGFPDYGWEENAGYLTKTHRDAIAKFGLLFGPVFYEHRKSYCSKLLGKVKNAAVNIVSAK